MALGSTLAIERPAPRPAKGHWHDFAWITEQQAVVLELICDGLRPAEIAERLGKSYSYVRDTVRLARLRTDSRTLEHLIARYATLREQLPQPQRTRVIAKGDTAA